MDFWFFQKKGNVANGDTRRAENKLECQRNKMKIENSN